jgi:hypothetical protein
VRSGRCVGLLGLWSHSAHSHDFAHPHADSSHTVGTPLLTLSPQDGGMHGTGTSRTCALAEGRTCKQQDTRILFGLQIRTLGPYLAYSNGILILPGPGVVPAESTSGSGGSEPPRATPKKGISDSWAAQDANGQLDPGADYLYELGKSDLNLNIDTGAPPCHCPLSNPKHAWVSYSWANPKHQGCPIRFCRPGAAAPGQPLHGKLPGAPVGHRLSLAVE